MGKKSNKDLFRGYDKIWKTGPEVSHSFHASFGETNHRVIEE